MVRIFINSFSAIVNKYNNRYLYPTLLKAHKQARKKPPVDVQKKSN